MSFLLQMCYTIWRKAMKQRTGSELDIAGNIRQIEMLKCDLLCGVS